jgi:hypothetical protein
VNSISEKENNLAAIGILTVVYFVTGKLGLTMALCIPVRPPFGPPRGSRWQLY